MSLGCCQYSRFDHLQMWYKDPRHETHKQFTENMAWHTTTEMHDSKFQESYHMPYNAMEDLMDELHLFSGIVA